MVDKIRWVAGAVSLVALTIAPACDDDVNSGTLHGEVANDDDIDFTPVDDAITFREIEDNGVNMNGLRLNGLRLNGLRLNGLRLNGLRLNGINLGVAPVSGLTITTGSLLSGFDTGSSQTKVGAQLANTLFDMDLDEGGGPAPARLKIASVAQSSLQSDVYFYDIKTESSPGVWESACTDAAGNPVEAIALKNHWNTTTARRESMNDAITWACRGAALAKAVEWGYRPWATHDGVALDDFHAAAVNMIRADYCGEGEAHTANGNAIDVADKLGLQVHETAWPVEAKWGPNGAVCLNTPRKLFWPRETIPCANELPACTNNDPAEFGGLLMTRAIPNDIH